MIEVRPLATLGAADHGWLDAHHHFSFADHYDPDRMGWGRLRVWNDDRIAPGAGFPPHGHRDMEIITYVRSGAISHRDNLGNEGRTEAGDVQVMSAGTGIMHAEYNAEDIDTTIFQIWIETDRPGAPPSWGARPFPRDDRAGRWETLASGVAGDDALPINADARVVGATVKAGDSIDYPLAPGRRAYLVAATGAIDVNGQRAVARDGVAIRDVDAIHLTAIEDSEVVLVETN